MPWIELHQSLPTHKKLLRLTGLLRIKPPQAVGHLALLWLWALDNAPDGDLSALSPGELAQVCQFSPRRAGELLEALVSANLLEREGGALRIHDWADYGGKYQQKREKSRERQRRWVREQKRAANALVTPQEERTGEQSTEEQSTQEERKNISCADAAAGACAGADAARGWIQDYLKKRGEAPDSFMSEPEEAYRQAEALTAALLSRFSSREPTGADIDRVFGRCTVRGEGGRAEVDPDRRDLLIYAFEQAAAEGKGGQWAYIEGVLRRLEDRHIRTLREAERFELVRDAERE